MKKHASIIVYTSYIRSFVSALLVLAWSLSPLSATKEERDPNNAVKDSHFKTLQIGNLQMEIIKRCDSKTREATKAVCCLFYEWTGAAADSCTVRHRNSWLSTDDTVHCKERGPFLWPETFSPSKHLIKALEGVGRMSPSLEKLSFRLDRKYPTRITNQHCEQIASLPFTTSLRALEMWGCTSDLLFTSR